MTPEQLAAIRELASKATPGPWTHRPESYDDWGMIRGGDNMPVASASMAARTPDEGPHKTWQKGGFPEPEPIRANAAYIAALDPTTVLGMVAEIERLRELYREARAALWKYDAQDPDIFDAATEAALEKPCKT